MMSPILATKLYKPKPKAKWVKRPRLIEKLNEGLERKLSLVSAPAGFGKTSLVSAWLAASEVQSAWLSLDENDGNVKRFLAYFVAALKTLDPAVGQDALATLQSPQPSPAETLLTILVNDISRLSEPFIFVLDDYHVIDSKAVDKALSFLIEHQPPNLHLAITTREDPQLPLARLRVRDELTELRASDLRFSENEVSSFLNGAMGLELSEEAITRLETRTEGWVAGLQMAALSMQGLSDTAQFIQAFTGSHHFVLDYLLEEVLQQQPKEIQSFLLQTSILEQLNASLCNAVTKQSNSQITLERLERENLFVIALDDERRWYRYHHLFSDVLQARLKNDQVNVNDLHLRASHWYLQQGLVMQAIQSAVAAQDAQRVATLIEQNWRVIRKNRQEIVVLSWLKTLPEELLKTRPVLSAIYGVVLLNRREYEQANMRLQTAEVWLDDNADLSQMIVVDESQFRSLAATIANARVHHAQALGDVSASIFHAEKALELLQEDDDYERGTTAALLGLAYWAKGDLAAAERSMADGTKIFEKSKNYLITVGASVILAQVMMLQGKLHKAKKTHSRAINFVTQQAEANAQGTANLYRGLTELHYWGLSELYYHWGNLEIARQVLSEGENLSTQAYPANVEHHYSIAKARLEDAEGNIAQALELLAKAEQLNEQGPVPDVRPVAALRARLWIKQGNFKSALVWAHEQKLSPHDELSYLLEFNHITLARLLIAQFKAEKDQRYLDEARDLLARLLKEAEGNRVASVIEILILQALTFEVKSDAAAIVILQEALRLAEPEGYIQMFVNEGEPMARLIKDIAKRTKTSNHLRLLQAACKSTKKASTQATMTSSMLERLSERELDVLKMLRSELSGPDIACHLGVSLNTIRTHTKNIYSKLEVNNRRAAINRAGELDLL